MSEWAVRLVLAGAAAGCDTALDVGSGAGKYRAPVRYVASVDAYQRANFERHVVGDLLEVLPTFAAGEFDLVYCLDVIEHLAKDDGLRLLDHMERVARKSVLVFTPNGFMLQESEIPWQVHRSGWNPQDFRARGYQVALMDFDYGAGVQPLRALWALRVGGTT